MGRSLILVAVLLLAACSPQAKHGAAKSDGASHRPTATGVSAGFVGTDWVGGRVVRSIMTPASSPGVWEKAGEYQVRSRVRTVWIVPTADLSTIPYASSSEDPGSGDNPRDMRSAEGCDRTRVMEPKTSAGKWVRGRGWRVAAEETLGPLTAVVALRRYVYETGTCWPFDGRIILFRGNRPLATVLTAADQVLQIGALERTERGALRLETGSEHAPLGDLMLEGTSIEVEPLPSSDVVCAGRGRIPNILGMNIRQGRRLLRNGGWMPVTMPRANPREDLGAASEYDEGLTEVSECGPRALCGFRYRAAGITIEFAAEGSESVYAYQVDCGRHLHHREPRVADDSLSDG